ARTSAADLAPSAAAPAPAAAEARAAVLIDEHDARPWDGSPPERSPEAHAASVQPDADGRAAAHAAPWIELLEGALEQFERDRQPFAVLLIELLDVEHLRARARAGELPRVMRQIEGAAARALELIRGIPAASL